jgi:hypothetical protein
MHDNSIWDQSHNIAGLQSYPYDGKQSLSSFVLSEVLSSQAIFDTELKIKPYKILSFHRGDYE